MFKRLAAPTAIIVALLAGIAAVSFMQWRSVGLDDPYIIRETARYGFWSTLAVAQPDPPDVRWTDFQVDKGRRTFKGTLALPRTVFNIAGQEFPGPSGQTTVSVKGTFQTKDDPVGNPLGLPLTRLMISTIKTEFPTDSRLSGGEESERWWKETQTDNDLFDAGLGLPRDPMKPDFDRPWRLFNLFAARHFRRKGELKGANLCLSIAANYRETVEPLPPAWAARVQKEKELLKAGSRE